VNETEPDESLMEILNTTLPKEDYGPDSQNDVAESVSRLFANKQPKEKLDSYKTEHKLPNNCKSLGISKVNPEIWNMLPQKIKQVDYVHQLQQQQISLAAIKSAKTAEIVFTAGDKIERSTRDNFLKLCLETETVLGSSMQEVNQNLKSEIRPSLSKEASSICSTASTPEWLFGDNVTDQLRSAKTTANVLRTAVGSGGYAKGLRYTPYKGAFTGQKNLNWRGPPQLRRGGYQTRSWRGRPILNRPDYTGNRTSRPQNQ
jgi:hypothetical protein